MQSLDDFLTCMEPLKRHWPEPSAEAWADYRAVLGHFPVEVLAAAVVEVLASHVYPTFPKPGVIRAAADSVVALSGRAGLEAWGDVMRAVVKFGYNKPPDGVLWTFKDPLVLEAVNAIGWASICQSEDEMVFRAHFIKCYEQIRDRTASAARELPAVAAVREQVAGRREQIQQLTAGIGNRK